jgi:pilus assembly protein CpaE
MSRVVLIAADEQLEHQARVLLGDEVIALPPAAADLIVARLVRLPRRPELVILGDGMLAERAYGIARAAQGLADTFALVTWNLDLKIPAREAGITEFLAPDVDLEKVDALLERSRKVVAHVRQTAGGNREQTAPGWITVVASPKGGVGKTTVAVNLAVALATETPGAKVVLVDLDLQFGDVATVLGVQPLHTIADAVTKAAARDEFVLRSFLVEHPSGIAALCAPSGPAGADAVEASRIGHLLQQLAADFDEVVVDTGPGLGEHVLAALEQANGLLMVGGLDMPSLRGIRSELDVLHELDLIPPVQATVLNAVDARVGIRLPDAQRLLGGRVDAAVPRRRAVQLATNYGVPVVQGAPKDPASREIRKIARRLLVDAHAGTSRRALREADRPTDRPALNRKEKAS